MLRVAGLVLVSVLALVSLGIFAGRSLSTLNEGTDFAEKTLRGQYQISKVLQVLVDMGGGQRRFESTHAADSFDEARAAAAVLPGELAVLRRLLADDPDEAANMTKLVQLSEERQRQTRRMIEGYLAGTLDEAATAAVRADGNRIMDACRATTRAMQARETQRWQARIALAEHARKVVTGAVTAIVTIGSLLILLVAVLSMRYAARLRRTEEELVTTLRSIGDAVISTDPQGRVRFMNAVAEKLTGWSTDQARDLPLEEVFRIVGESTRAPAENPVSRVLRVRGAVGADNPSVLLSRDGAERPIEDSGAPIYGADGAIVGMVLVFRDDTERRAAERALLDSQLALRKVNANLEQQVVERTAQLMIREALIRTFYEHSSECHAILEELPEGAFRYQEVNPATLRLYGKSRSEVIGRTTDEIHDASTAATLNGYLSECLRRNEPFRYERTSGAQFIEAVASPVPDEPGVGRRIVVSARDVTERRRLEQQLLQSQKMEAVGQLTGGLAHDFNNMLTGIQGSLELLQTRVAQGRVDDLSRFVTAAQGAAKRASALTHRLLAFSRRQTLDAKPTDVNRLITDMVELIQRTVGPAVKIDVVTAMGLWRPSVDANQLENALLNLCINARDAMPEGGKITIETANRWLDARTGLHRELSSGQYVSLCVSDTGCGMPPDVASRAFDPFFTTKPLGEGTGLGLSMIYGFARQSGGHAQIYSEVGKGTMVCIYLPRHLGEEEPAEPEPPLVIQPSTGDGKTVMVVDDEPTVRMLVTEVLKDLNYRAIECHDGAEALRILESKQHIDLLVTDVGLPNGMNGRQLADFARVLRPRLKVLFITGYAENAAYSHGHIEMGFEVLCKPFEMDFLAARIAALIPKN
jgi:PAS domain S-box-containing protein